ARSVRGDARRPPGSRVDAGLLRAEPGGGAADRGQRPRGRPGRDGPGPRLCVARPPGARAERGAEHAETARRIAEVGAALADARDREAGFEGTLSALRDEVESAERAGAALAAGNGG